MKADSSAAKAQMAPICAAGVFAMSVQRLAASSTRPERASVCVITSTIATVTTAGLLKPAKAASGLMMPARTQIIRAATATMSKRQRSSTKMAERSPPAPPEARLAPRS